MENRYTRTSAHRRNKSNLSAVAIFVVVFAVAFFGTKMLFGGNAVDKQLKAVADKINKSCPMNVDSETRLDSVASFDGAKIQYYYSLITVVKQDTTFHAEDLKELVEGQSQHNLDTNPTMKEFREKNVEMGYTYKDKNGQQLFEFTITPTKKK